MKITKNIFLPAAAGFAALVVALSTIAPASAHVTVTPGEATTASYQTFTISVPNEKTIPTVGVKLLIPETLGSATPTQKAGWQIVKETTGEGDAQTTTSLSWEGGSIADGTRDEFTFSAKLPEKGTELQWKAYQTYSDGTVVAWDQDEHGKHGHGGNSGPFSVTKVAEQSEAENATTKTDKAAKDAATNAERALYLGVGALALSGVAVGLALRKK